MERITDKIAALPEGGSFFSLEFFPPKTQQVYGNDIACAIANPNNRCTGFR